MISREAPVIAPDHAAAAADAVGRGHLLCPFRADRRAAILIELPGLTILAINFMGDTLCDTLDPRQRQ